MYRSTTEIIQKKYMEIFVDANCLQKDTPATFPNVYLNVSLNLGPDSVPTLCVFTNFNFIDSKGLLLLCSEIAPKDDYKLLKTGTFVS